MPKSPVFFLIIIKQILSTADGRDKLFKVVQYSLKVDNWIRNSKNRTELIATLSMTRKMVRLANGLDPLLEIKSQSLEKLDLNTINNIASLVSDVADDVICLGKLNLIDSKWIRFATPISDRSWFITIIIDIFNLSQTIKEDSNNLKKISMVKLFADLIFCSIDVFKLDPSPGWQNLSGLVSGSLGTIKLIQKKL